MKTILKLISFFCLIQGYSFAQAPEKMSYQAVIRNATNDLLSNQTVGMRVSLLQGSTTGTIIFSETHTTNTNLNGLVSIEIGSGNILSGDFTTIDWANGPYYVQTETDLTGGTNYTLTQTTQMMSVPYALYAKTAGNSSNSWSLSGNNNIGTNHFIGTTDSSSLEIKTNNESRIYISPTGNVGIGYPFADQKLHLQSGDGLSLRFKVNENVNFAELQTNKAGGSNLVLQNAGGYVGIGQKNPISCLHVTSMSNYASEITVEALPTHSGFHNGAIVLKSIDTNSAPNKRGLGFFMHDQLGTNEWFFGRPYGTSLSGSSDQFVVQRRSNTPLHNTSTAGLYDGTNQATGTERFFVISNNGNVGIGINTPQRKLHINDVMRLEPQNQAPSNPSKGDMYFDNITNKLRVYDGTNWQSCW